MWTAGLVSISFRDRGVEEICRVVKEAGLTAVEWGSDVHAPCDDAQRLREIAAWQNRYGIRCSSYGTYFRLGQMPVSELPAYFAAAKALGTTVLRLWCGNRPADAYTEAEKAALFADGRAAAALAEAAGMTLCMECHPDTFTETRDGMEELMRAVASPAFRMYWQPNQNATVDENLAYAEAAAPYTVNIHVFHWQGRAHLPLRDGLAVWRRYLRVFDGTQGLLLEFMPDGRAESLPQEAAALADLMGGDA